MTRPPGPEDERGTRSSRGHAGERAQVPWPIVQCPPTPVIAAIDGAAVGMGVEFEHSMRVGLVSAGIA